MKIKLLIFLVLLLFNTIPLFAEGEKCLVILLKSGMQVTLPVIDEPKITFDGTVMSVGNGDYQIENVRKWMVGTVETLGVGMASHEGGISYRDGMLTMSDPTGLHVFNAAGMEIPVGTKPSAKGGFVADLSPLPAGIYLVKFGKETLKIRKQ